MHKTTAIHSPEEILHTTPATNTQTATPRCIHALLSSHSNTRNPFKAYLKLRIRFFTEKFLRFIVFYRLIATGLLLPLRHPTSRTLTFYGISFIIFENTSLNFIVLSMSHVIAASTFSGL